jgi:leucine dehydrogenase
MFDYMEYMVEHGHEQMVFCHDRDSGLRAIIAVHNTVLGPSLGGTRLWKYEKESDAILDVLRLSEGMTYKSAVAGLALGGGKAVIMADGKESDPEIRTARFTAFGKFIDSISGRYITAEDVGTSPADMMIVDKVTDHVAGLPAKSGDPSPWTALGTIQGIRAMVEEYMGKDSLEGICVAVQGLGHVGLPLVKLLLEAGANITGTDINPDYCKTAAELGVKIIEPDAIYDVECDIFSPNALGAIINDETIPRIKCKIVAGASNNQLKDIEKHSKVLQEKNIAYAVDYVINAGGVINVAHEVGGYDEDTARASVMRVYDSIKQTIAISREQGVTTQRASEIMAQEVLAAAKN